MHGNKRALHRQAGKGGLVGTETSYEDVNPTRAGAPRKCSIWSPHLDPMIFRGIGNTDLSSCYRARERGTVGTVKLRRKHVRIAAALHGKRSKKYRDNVRPKETTSQVTVVPLFRPPRRDGEKMRKNQTWKFMRRGSARCESSRDNLGH